MKRKLFSILLSLALVLTMIPAMTAVSSASSFTNITVTDGETLYDCLSEGGYNIKIGADISYQENGSYSYWCETSDKNILDLNGHEVTISNDNSVMYSTLLRVRGGSELIICDSAGGGELHYNGYINKDGDLRYRHLIAVDGVLTVNGGELVAGRSKNEYVAKYAKSMYKQTFGTTIRVNNGGKAVINGGTLWARGCPPESTSYPKANNLWVDSNGKAVINGGTFICKSGADSICNTGANGNLVVKGGEFTCEKLDAILIDGHGYSSATGYVGIVPGNLGQFNGTIEKDKETTYLSTHVKLTPKTMQKGMELTADAPKVNGSYIPNDAAHTFAYGYDSDSCYWNVFPFTSDGYRGSGHKLTYYWKIYEGDSTKAVAGATLSRPGKFQGTFDNTVDLLKDLHPMNSSGMPDTSKSFVPQYGVTYRIGCSAAEEMGGRQLWSESFDRPEFYFLNQGAAASMDLKVTAPKAGEKPDKTYPAAPKGYKVTNVRWFLGRTALNDRSSFEAGKSYLCIVNLEALSGYDVPQTVTAKINGETASITLKTKTSLQLERFFKVPESGEGTEPVQSEPTHMANSTVNVRQEPSTGSSRIGGLSQGDQVTVVDTQGDWYKIEYGDGFGWVMGEFLNPLKIEPLNLNPFVDVYSSDTYYDAVLWAYYANPQITNGIDATHFGPLETVTRGQCAAFLWRAMGEPEPNSTYNPFKDVPEWQYYYKPILWAVENGITKGTSADTFSPDQKLSTAHIITFLYRTKNKGEDGWYEKARDWATKDYGTNKPFGVTMLVSPEVNCERAWVVYFLEKLN